MTRKEVPIFLKAVKEHAPQHYAMFITAIHTGVRQGELASLQTGDIDFNGKYLVVQRSIDRIHRKVVPTKTKRIRRVDLSDELIAVLKDHIRRRPYDMRHMFASLLLTAGASIAYVSEQMDTRTFNSR